MVEFTVEQLAHTVVAVADERPDYVYISPDNDLAGGQCKYNHYGVPGCIYGHALARLGVDITKMPNRGIGVLLALWFGGRSDAAVYAPFIVVQWEQDHGTPWGVAVRPLRAAYPVMADG